ncbi:MAG: hypothetical protein AB7S70_08230 [Hyphomicrobium sp.]|uniref:hypothetical protein n=1 Tax=Hyphomicrobium sp. TaxID=82 RepID=UPI003D1412A2
MKAMIIAVVALAFSANQAFAVSHAVKMACASDYFAHCSMHSPGSPGVRKCMRAVGANLSAQCINALATAGEISKATHKKYFAKQQSPKKLIVSKKAEKRYAKAATKRKMTASSSSKRKLYAENQIKKKRYAKSTKKKYAKKQFDRKREAREYAKRDVARG